MFFGRFLVQRNLRTHEKALMIAKLYLEKNEDMRGMFSITMASHINLLAAEFGLSYEERGLGTLRLMVSPDDLAGYARRFQSIANKSVRKHVLVYMAAEIISGVLDAQRFENQYPDLYFRWVGYQEDAIQFSEENRQLCIETLRGHVATIGDHMAAFERR